MIYVVQFEDNESHGGMREKFMAEHLAFLERHAHAICGAGPLKDPESGAVAGGLWLVTADSESEVRTLIERDPFWPTGLRKSVTVFVWDQVFANGERLR